MDVSAPPSSVLAEFGVNTPARKLPGGQGTSWHAGDIVLKPGAGEVQEWLAGVLADLNGGDVRLQRPVATRAGHWSCEGWSATRWVDGSERTGATASSWVAVIEAGRAFHRAVAHLDRPECLNRRNDPWAVADRQAWGERPPRLPPELDRLAERLQPALLPLGPSQLVHGDLTTNVLFAPGRLPAVIDVSPYWRPTAYAEGVVVADALCWHGASPDLLEKAGVPVAAVARALLFRMATAVERARPAASGVGLGGETMRYARATASIGL